MELWHRHRLLSIYFNICIITSYGIGGRHSYSHLNLNHPYAVDLTDCFLFQLNIHIITCICDRQLYSCLSLNHPYAVAVSILFVKNKPDWLATMAHGWHNSNPLCQCNHGNLLYQSRLNFLVRPPDVWVGKIPISTICTGADGCDWITGFWIRSCQCSTFSKTSPLTATLIRLIWSSSCVSVVDCSLSGGSKCWNFDFLRKNNPCLINLFFSPLQLFHKRKLKYFNLINPIVYIKHRHPLLTNYVYLYRKRFEHLSFDKHVSDVCRSTSFHSRALAHVRRSITTYMAKTVATAIVGSKLDYCNSLLHGASAKNISRLQRIQNYLARVVVGRGRYDIVSLQYLRGSIGRPCSNLTKFWTVELSWVRLRFNKMKRNIVGVCRQLTNR